MSPAEKTRLAEFSGKLFDAMEALLDEGIAIRRLHEGAAFDDAAVPTVRAMLAVDFGAKLVVHCMGPFRPVDATLRYALVLRAAEQFKAELIKAMVPSPGGTKG